ncbi:hypothetical protein ACIPDS_21380 [Kluyvera sp. NPDC087067]
MSINWPESGSQSEMASIAHGNYLPYAALVGHGADQGSVSSSVALPNLDG